MTDVLRPHPDLIARADQALVRTVDALSDHEYAEPSQLPGWTRGHVVAHLALNAEGLAGVLHGAHIGRPQPMYATPEARDADIAELATAEPTELRERFLAATARFGEALEAMSESDWDGRFERTPGGPDFALGNVVLMRLREVEIHHADLRAGYSHADWPQDTAVRFFEHDAGRYDGPPLTAHATDLDRRIPLGTPTDDDPVVSGPVSALAWWATGRDPGDLLTSSTGAVPAMEGR